MTAATHPGTQDKSSVSSIGARLRASGVSPNSGGNVCKTPKLQGTAGSGRLHPVSMHIVHLITKLDVGGAQSVVRDLALCQLRDGNRVSIICGINGPVADELRRSGAEVHVAAALNHSIGIRDLRGADDLAKVLRRLSPDVVHCHSSKGGFLGRIAARKVGVPVVYTAHGWLFRDGPSPARRLLSFVGEWVGARIGGVVICVSESDMQFSNRLRVTRSSKSMVVRNGTGSAVVGKARRFPSAATTGLTLVMVARFAPQKRQDLVIDALRLLPERVRVIFVGGGDGLAMCQQQVANDPQISGRVEFLGVTDPSLALERADVMVLMSNYEGLSMSMLEGMRACLPVVANRLPGVSEAIVDGHNGVLVEKTAESLADAISVLLADLDKGGSMICDLGSAAFETWRTEFTAEAMNAGYREVYERVLALKSASSVS